MMGRKQDMRRKLLLLFAVAVAAVMPIAGQRSSVAAPASVAVPDLSGVWNHPAFPWFEPPASGPGPITNLSRWAEQRPAGLTGSAALPPSTVGISDYDQLVGDYKSPILQPWAAAVVKRLGEMSLAGVTFPNPSNQCWPFPVPFIYKQFQVQLIQQPDRVTMLYSGDHEVRRVRMNASHPSPLKPSWYGDSVGHYEGDTLVIDTVGVRTDRPYAMLDLFGTPFSDRLHIVERFRLRSYDDVKDAIERNRKENWLFNGDVWADYHGGKYLQLQITIEDEGVFTTPWTATLTYVPDANPIPEGVCAENPHEYYSNKDSDVPKASKPDF
ncbi:MAG TPA: hypothetical protein VHT51_11210 [Micropepsaceae bacterium]|nr:hypothetical protein [Micropepsaceae bacterium]